MARPFGILPHLRVVLFVSAIDRKRDPAVQKQRNWSLVYFRVLSRPSAVLYTRVNEIFVAERRYRRGRFDRDVAEHRVLAIVVALYKCVSRAEV